MTRRQLDWRSALWVLLFLALSVAALAPPAFLGLSSLHWALQVAKLPPETRESYARIIPWYQVYVTFIGALSVLFVSAVVSLWLTSRDNIPWILWGFFLVGALALAVGFPVGTVVGCAAFLTLLLMKARERCKRLERVSQPPGSEGLG
jgi:hypothetical protein